MKLCYTVSGIKGIEQHHNFDAAQYTMNSRVFPSKRNDISLLKEMRRKGIKTNIIIHWDFIYIASRYLLFNKSVKEAIISKISELIRYADTEDSGILGIVIHTDWPIKKVVSSSGFSEEIIKREYNSSLWDKNSLDYISRNNISILEESIKLFISDLKEKVKECNCKIYLENTTKVGPNSDGDFDSISKLFLEYPYFKDVAGIAYDLEHDYAVTGESFRNLDFLLDRGIKVLVHLNTIPNEVEPKSKKDRHSFTTILECSKFTLDEYNTYIKYLEEHDIPWVREVKEETMEREIKQLWN